ncbi:peptidyl-tRNA hydrolase 2-like [Oopsacas minuta]|uniref:peptidyl-tRNA hydrolase n=1 Tax=Oopsacas minuta TaxID=111878 RepID=A0AAV7K6X9_9METZ|nr:peptidyl-tRNA hydrolase 2-like [Oopsacas minuta]
MGITSASTYRMTFIVNKELRMGAGKIAAQVAHACLSLYTEITNNSSLRRHCNSWYLAGQTKVVLQCHTTEELMSLFRDAGEEGLACYLVRDAGRTQVEAGACTVLGVFGDEIRLRRLIGNLKLL